MTSVRAALTGIARAERPGIIGYLTIGDPDEATFRRAAHELVSAGCVALELGLPTSDPPEGDILRASHARARASVSPEGAFSILGQLVKELPCPTILVGYWSSLGEAGLAHFLATAASHAVTATLIVGLSFGALERYRDLSQTYGLETILTVSAATPGELRQFIYGATTGFIYVIADDASTVIERIQAESDLPIVVGKKVSDPGAVAAAGAAGAHSVAIGAALVDRLSRGLPLAEWIQALRGN